MLTVKEINALQGKPKAYSVSDGSALFLLIRPNGGKYWQYRYRFHKKQKIFSIGVFPEVGLKEARDKLVDAKRLVQEGIDPNDVKKNKKIHSASSYHNTFKNVANEYIESKKTLWSLTHYKKTIALLNKNVFPFIGDKPIENILAKDILSILKRLEAQNKFETRNKIKQHCSAIFNNAILSELCTNNPCIPLKSVLQKHSAQHYPHILEHDLPEFLNLIDTYKGSLLIIIAIKLLIITGTRPGEIRNASWSEINFQKKIWTIPPERMKRKNTHIVPLSKQAISLLKQAKNISGACHYIFIGQQNFNKTMSDAAINRLIAQIGYKGKVTGHGFRHTMSTILHEHNYNSAHIELQLAHVDKNSIRGTYNHALYLDDRRKMLQWYADYLDQLKTTN